MWPKDSQYTWKGRAEDMQAPANTGPAVLYCFISKKKDLGMEHNIHVRWLMHRAGALDWECEETDSFEWAEKAILNSLIFKEFEIYTMKKYSYKRSECITLDSFWKYIWKLQPIIWRQQLCKFSTYDYNTYLKTTGLKIQAIKILFIINQFYIKTTYFNNHCSTNNMMSLIIWSLKVISPGRKKQQKRLFCSVICIYLNKLTGNSHFSHLNSTHDPYKNAFRRTKQIYVCNVT